MEPVPQNVRLVRRAYWLIRLRWIAIAGVVMAVFLAGRLFKVSLHAQPLYIISLLLAIYNLTAYIMLNHFTDNNHQTGRNAVKKIINFQCPILNNQVLFKKSLGNWTPARRTTLAGGLTIDELVKSRNPVIPAEAGIQRIYPDLLK